MLAVARSFISGQVASVPVPAINQGCRKLTKVTDYPKLCQSGKRRNYRH